MVRLALSHLAGVAVVQWAPQLPSPAMLLAGGLLCVLLAGALQRLWPVLFAAGVLLAVHQAQAILADRFPAALDGTEQLVSGVVVGVPERDADRVQFDLQVDGEAAARAALSLPQRIRVSWYRAAALPAPGERWRLQLKLRSPRGLINPGGFDYELKLARERIGATAYVRSEPPPRRLSTAEGRERIARARLAIATSMAGACAQCRNLGVLQALAVGLQKQVPDRQWRLFAATGITHLVAISGLHVTLFALLAAAAARLCLRLARRPHARLDIEAGVGVMAAAAYAVLAGLSVPTFRTLLMLTLWALALLWRRTLAAFELLALTLLVVLVLDPLDATTPGFLLSFGAVAAILAVMTGRLSHQGVGLSFLRTQGAVSIGLVPLLLVATGSVAWLSPLANAVAIPLFTVLVVPLVLLGAALSFLTPFSGWLLLAADRLLTLAFGWLEQLTRLPGADWAPAALPLPALGVALLAVIVALGAWPAVLRCLAVVTLAILLTWSPPRPAPGAWRLVLLDVGQGLAAVVETRSHVLVFDAGPGYRSGQSAGGRVVVPFLRSRGWHAIDLLVLSHDDLDHTGGAADLLRSFPRTARLAGPHLDAARCRAGQRWRWDGVRFEVLHPVAEAGLSDNDSSCVVRIVGTDARLLLVADIGGRVETQLVASHELASEVVLVAHHGSRSSSTAEWIDAVGARWALVSAARGNRWGFPRPEVVERWQASGARVLVTGDQGALTIESPTASRAPPRAERERQPHWWRAG